MSSLTITNQEVCIPTTNIPRLIGIYGPCRTGTTALAYTFVRAGITSYMQPIKSARQAKEIGERITHWIIEEGHVALTKETFGPSTEAGFFNPVEILLNIGYPKDKLICILILRDPRQTYASWKRMWDYVDIKNLVKTYKLTDLLMEKVKSLNIQCICYVHEAIRDNPPHKVISKLFQELDLQNSFSGITNWKDGPRFGDKDAGSLSLHFYDSPPEKFIEGVRNRGSYQYENLLYSEDDTKVVEENVELITIYEKFRKICQRHLDLKIKRYE